MQHCMHSLNAVITVQSVRYGKCIRQKHSESEIR